MHTETVFFETPTTCQVRRVPRRIYHDARLKQRRVKYWGTSECRQTLVVSWLSVTDAQTTVVNDRYSMQLSYCGCCCCANSGVSVNKLLLLTLLTAVAITGFRPFVDNATTFFSVQLPVRQRIIFMQATLVHNCLNGRAPAYTSLMTVNMLLRCIRPRLDFKTASSIATLLSTPNLTIVTRYITIFLTLS